MTNNASHEGPTPPAWSVVLARLGVLAILAAYFFVVYGLARGLIPEFGTSFSTVFKASLMSAIMGALVVWLVIGIELPEMLCSHVIPARRSRQHRCHACGHPVATDTSSQCAECGADLEKVPGGYALSWRTVRRFTVVFVLGLILGICAGEFSMSADEERMRQVIRALTTPNFSQPPLAPQQGKAFTRMQFQRRWPAVFSTVEWTRDTGFVPIPIFQQERITP